MPFLSPVTSNRYSSLRTTVSHQSPPGSAPQGLPCHSGAVFPQPGGNCQAVVFKHHQIPDPGVLRHRQPAGLVLQALEPRRGEKGRGQHVPGAGAATATLCAPAVEFRGTSRALGTSPEPQASAVRAEVTRRRSEPCMAHRLPPDCACKGPGEPGSGSRDTRRCPVVGAGVTVGPGGGSGDT